MKYVKSFPYLGRIVNSDASFDDEIINRIAKAFIAFGRLHHRLLGQRGVKLDIKIQVYRAVILSTLLHESETWIPNGLQINQLDIFQKRSLSSICGYTFGDKVPNVQLEVLKRSSCSPNKDLVRMSDDRIPRILMYSD